MAKSKTKTIVTLKVEGLKDLLLNNLITIAGSTIPCGVKT